MAPLAPSRIRPTRIRPETYTATLTDAEGHTATSRVQITVYPAVGGDPGSELLPGILHAAVALSLGGAGIPPMGANTMCSSAAPGHVNIVQRHNR